MGSGMKFKIGRPRTQHTTATEEVDHSPISRSVSLSSQAANINSTTLQSLRTFIVPLVYQSYMLIYACLHEAKCYIGLACHRP